MSNNRSTHEDEPITIMRKQETQDMRTTKPRYSVRDIDNYNNDKRSARRARRVKREETISVEKHNRVVNRMRNQQVFALVVTIVSTALLVLFISALYWQAFYEGGLYQ